MIPFFLSGVGGKLFCIYHEPSPETGYRGELIFVPPFAEELNQSRHSVARAARRLASRGYGVLLLDLFGTGDSEGSFEECRWGIWREDVMKADGWLRARGHDKIGLWGLRLGALLAAETSAAHPGKFSRLVLWQPVTRGKNFLNQFLRIRMMGAVIGEGGTGETTTQLRACLERGEIVRINGYPLAHGLAHDLDRLDIRESVPESSVPVLWCEVTASSAELTMTSRRVLDAWTSQGANVFELPVVDEPFWSVQALEPVWADHLIAATAEAL